MRQIVIKGADTSQGIDGYRLVVALMPQNVVIPVMPSDASRCYPASKSLVFIFPVPSGGTMDASDGGCHQKGGLSRMPALASPECRPLRRIAISLTQELKHNEFFGDLHAR